AEDGIRDFHVTGVQTCALPIFVEYQQRRRDLLSSRGLDVSGFSLEQMTSADDVFIFPNLVGPIYPGSAVVFRVRPNGLDPDTSKIGRASCREGESRAVDVAAGR